MAEQERTTEPGQREQGRKADSPPDLDRAGGISRDELDTERSGERPVQQNDRTRDRELDPPKR